jgi:hypothetical protein
MKLMWDKWLYGLGSAVIGGGSGAVVSGVSTMLIAPSLFNVTSWAGVAKVFSVMAINFVLTGGLSMFFYLKQSPLPAEVDETKK